jgi:hypothetical protein
MSQPVDVNERIEIGGPDGPLGPKGTPTSVEFPRSSVVATMMVGPLARQPVDAGRKTCDSSVIGVGVANGVAEAGAVVAAGRVGDGVTGEGDSVGGLLARGVGETVEVADEQPTMVSVTTAAMRRRISSSVKRRPGISPGPKTNLGVTWPK